MLTMTEETKSFLSIFVCAICLHRICLVKEAPNYPAKARKHCKKRTKQVYPMCTPPSEQRLQHVGTVLLYYTEYVNK